MHARFEQNLYSIAPKFRSSKFHESNVEVIFRDKNFVITSNFLDSVLSHPFFSEHTRRPPRDLQFCEKNFRDLHVNHEIYENIVLQKLGAIRCLRGYWAF